MRPVVRVRGECDEDFETLDIGGCAKTLGRWKQGVLQTLESKYWIADYSHYLPQLAEVEAQQAAWKAEQRAERN